MMRASVLSVFGAIALASSASGQILINELYYDATGTDGGKTFIEIWGPPGLDLGGVTITSVEGTNNQTPGLGCGNPNQTGAIVIPPGSLIKADGFFVIADAEGGVTQVVCAATHNGGVPDLLVENADFENGPEEAVQLTLSGILLDAVQVNGPNPVVCTVDVNNLPMGFGTPAPDVFGGFSLERFPAGSNVGDNFTDFQVQGKPTPGGSKLPTSLVFDVGSISVTGGGATNLTLTVANGANRPYLILASITPPTGNDPLGVPYDPITDLFINLAATPNPLVVNFAGTLDLTNKAVATLTIPPGLVTLPGNIDFYFAGLVPVSLAGTTSNVAKITLTP